MDGSNMYFVVIDPTKKTQPALLRAAWLAHQSGARLHLYLCDYNQAISGDVFFDSARLAESRKSFLKHRNDWLEQLAAPHRDSGLTVTVEAVWGKRFHDKILEAVAALKPALVVKETVFHGKLRRALFSSSDWALIRECPTRVLLVRAGEWPENPVIIAAVDPFNDDDKPAELDDAIVRESQAMARQVSGRLRLMHAWQPILPSAIAPLPVPIPDGIDNDELRSSRQAGVEALAQRHGIDPSRVALCEGETPRALQDYVDEVGASLVVMGAVSRNRLERLVIGSTAEQVLDRLPCDTLIVKPA